MFRLTRTLLYSDLIVGKDTRAPATIEWQNNIKAFVDTVNIEDVEDTVATDRRVLEPDNAYIPVSAARIFASLKEELPNDLDLKFNVFVPHSDPRNFGPTLFEPGEEGTPASVARRLLRTKIIDVVQPRPHEVHVSPAEPDRTEQILMGHVVTSTDHSEQASEYVFSDHYSGRHLLGLSETPTNIHVYNNGQLLATEPKLEGWCTSKNINNIRQYSPISIDHVWQMAVIETTSPSPDHVSKTAEVPNTLTMHNANNLVISSKVANAAKHRYPPHVYNLTLLGTQLEFVPIEDFYTVGTRLSGVVSTVYQAHAMCCPIWQRHLQGFTSLDEVISIGHHVFEQLELRFARRIPSMADFTSNVVEVSEVRDDLFVRPGSNLRVKVRISV